MRKKFLFAVMALLTMATGNIWGQDASALTPYVIYDGNGTLYFLCHENAELTEITLGDNTIQLSTTGNDINCWKGTDVTHTESEFSRPGWYFKNSQVTSVVIEESFKNAEITNCDGWFKDCSKLTSLDLSNLNTSKVTNMNDMFWSCSGLTSLDLSNFDTSNVTDMSSMFWSCSGLTSLDLSNFNTSKVTTMSDMFRGCNCLLSIDLSNFDTSNVTYMGGIFNGCSGLTSLDVSNFNTSNAINMGSMFGGCSGLTSLDISNFNTSNATEMVGMFNGCSGLLSLDLKNFDTSNVTEMQSMFRGCSRLTSLDLSNFDTSNVTGMHSMFSGCSGLTSLDLSNFDTSNVTIMHSMFSGCSGLTSLDLSNFDTSNVTEMQSMFRGCSGLASLDLSNFDTSNVTKLNNMFYGCSSLTSLDLSHFNTSNVTDMSRMFYDCPSLRQLDLGKAIIPTFSDIEWEIENRPLTFVPAGTTVTEGRENVVVGADCEHFVIDYDDTANNQLLLNIPYSFTAKKITVNRNFTAENPHTLCLPFAVDAKAYGTFYAYKAYDESSKGVMFKGLSSATATEANKPYLFVPSETLESGIVIDTPTEVAAYTAETSADGEFIGVYKKKTFTQEEANEGVYYGWAGGEFKRAGEGASVDACRAYLKLPASSANRAPARLSVRLDGSATGINSAVNGADSGSGAPTYNLQGQRVGGSYRGVVIRNGKKMIAK